MSDLTKIKKELKETMLKEVKEGIKIVSHQIENINRNGNYKEEPNGKFGVEKFSNYDEKLIKGAQQYF